MITGEEEHIFGHRMGQFFAKVASSFAAIGFPNKWKYSEQNLAQIRLLQVTASINIRLARKQLKVPSPLFVVAKPVSHSPDGETTQSVGFLVVRRRWKKAQSQLTSIGFNFCALGILDGP